MEAHAITNIDEYADTIQRITALMKLNKWSNNPKIKKWFVLFENVLIYKDLLPPIPKKYRSLRERYTLNPRNYYNLKKMNEWAGVLIQIIKNNAHIIFDCEEDDDVVLK